VWRWLVLLLAPQPLPSLSRSHTTPLPPRTHAPRSLARSYSLLGAYASSPAFHAADGSGYAFLAGCVARLDGVNPTVAARIVAAFARYRSYDPARQALMRAQLAGLAASAGGKLSENVGEIVARSLAA
jgi:aminopeptidase N